MKNNVLENESCVINNLIQCSNRTENLENEISIKDWDAVCSWTQTTPICRYTNKPQSKEKRKKGSSKNKKLNNPFSPPSQDKPSSEKYIGSKTGPLENHYANNKCKQYEIQLEQRDSMESCKTDGGLTTRVQNKLSKSSNVLSYEHPSWRFLLDNKEFRYIERISPKDRVYNFLKRTKSSSTKSSSIKQILDPAGFIDEQIAISYKNSKAFQPDQELRSLMSRINNICTHDFEQPKDLQRRLYLTSCIKKLPISLGENETVTTYGSATNNSSTYENTRNKKPSSKKNKTIKQKTNKKKKIPKTLKYQQHRESTSINKKCVLPKISPKQQQQKQTTEIATLVEHSPLCRVFPPTKTFDQESTVPRIDFQTEELYLPLLNHSNYTSKLQYLKRPEVKLPAVAGIKISLSSTSNSGLVL